MKININTTLLIGIIILILFYFFDRCSKGNKAEKDNLKFIAALQDTVRHFKNKDSANVAQISVLTTQKAQAFIDLYIADSTVRDLQATVKEYKGKLKAGSSVTNALIETVAQLKGRKPDVKYLPGDTLWKDSVAYIYPTYGDSLSNEWITLKAEMGLHSSIFDLKVVNKFSAIVGYDKKKKLPFVDLVTENPYTTVKSLRTYQVAVPKPKRFGIGVSTGITYDFSLKKPAPYFGVGLNYNILRL